MAAEWHDMPAKAELKAYRLSYDQAVSGCDF
ncbi:hypothetical protein JOC55_002495 [Paenibacillus sacheonensis]|nr:hypothetical protein [Paenibacillus sacheonensis]